MIFYTTWKHNISTYLIALPLWRGGTNKPRRLWRLFAAIVTYKQRAHVLSETLNEYIWIVRLSHFPEVVTIWSWPVSLYEICCHVCCLIAHTNCTNPTMLHNNNNNNNNPAPRDMCLSIPHLAGGWGCRWAKDPHRHSDDVFIPP